ncbi:MULTISPECIES: MBL fold metallo-hydrolase [Peribacillus]|uniref:MBL fold metallo-hydrolase n=1 Tax=Peribacillus TaxID=2675229 RepID=UPI0019126725|nr:MULTISPECIES: MBL fold metallo-hydrolase [unclassified Peribacillus]MBK5445580.1 MBL fold metallo-hydrolase [Peribacillus sp. TH24]MBK5459700.1 MBL fold metallo-hydrolase [Peribacillus sp. TH27]WMX56992.1 MBL fold metallo-hydrolase [Peribacillus sp. R9-11]
MKTNTLLEIYPIMAPSALSLKSINFYLVKQDESLTLVDAGMNDDVCWNALQNTLKENGFTIKDITEILLTHHHGDHVGLVNRITALHPIPVYAHSKSVPRLKRDPDFLSMRIEFYKQLYLQMGCGELGDKQVAYLFNAVDNNKDQRLNCDIIEITEKKWLNFEVIEFPGHAPDQIAFLDQKEKRLLAGDLLIEHISSNALIEPDENGNRMLTLVDHIDSLKRCLSLQINLILPGHGNIIEHPGSLIEKRLNSIESKSQKILALIESGISTGNELAKTFYKEKYVKEFPLVMSEIIGHLDYLEYQEKINKEIIKNVVHYYVK